MTILLMVMYHYTKVEKPAATLTRRLQKLEHNLGCKLLHRTPRGVQLTPKGLHYFEQCQPLMSALEHNIQNIYEKSHQTTGTVRVLAPVNLSMLTANFWGHFLTQHPHINIQLSLNNFNENLLEQEADIALRVGKQKDSNLMQKRLTSMDTCIVASPQYLAKQAPIKHPSDLLQQQWCIAEPLSQLSLTHRQTQENAQPTLQKGRIAVNEIQLCVALAKQGIGLAYVPQTICQKELNNGELHIVLPDWKAPTRNLYMIWNAQKNIPTRVRVLLDALSEFFIKKDE